jgi:hypothetical protein
MSADGFTPANLQTLAAKIVQQQPKIIGDEWFRLTSTRNMTGTIPGLHAGSLTVNLDNRSTSGNGTAIRYRIEVTGQKKEYRSLYVTNVSEGTPAATIRTCLRAMVLSCVANSSCYLFEQSA